MCSPRDSVCNSYRTRIMGHENQECRGAAPCLVWCGGIDVGASILDCLGAARLGAGTAVKTATCDRVERSCGGDPGDRRGNKQLLTGGYWYWLAAPKCEGSAEFWHCHLGRLY